MKELKTQKARLEIALNPGMEEMFRDELYKLCEEYGNRVTELEMLANERLGSRIERTPDGRPPLGYMIYETEDGGLAMPETLDEAMGQIKRKQAKEEMDGQMQEMLDFFKTPRGMRRCAGHGDKHRMDIAAIVEKIRDSIPPTKKDDNTPAEEDLDNKE